MDSFVHETISNNQLYSSLLKNKLFIYGCTGSLLLHMGFLLIVVSRGYSLVAVHEFLIAEASLVEKHRF